MTYDYTTAQTARLAERDRKQAIFTEFQTFAKTLNENLPPIPRTWGVEIEAPNLDGIAYNLEGRSDYVLGKSGRIANDYPLFFTSDGSVKNEDAECECECYECEHECDCEHCDRQDYLDHACGSAECTGTGEFQEVATIGGLKSLADGGLDELAGLGIQDLRYNDTCGLHLNIGSGDLTAPQVARVLSTYRRLAHILDAIAGRGETYYANAPTQSDIDNTLNRHATHKYSQVNTAHHFGNGGETTRLEFRQVAGEQFRGNPELIRAWAFLLIEIVEFAKTDQPIFWIGCTKTLSGAMTELARR